MWDGIIFGLAGGLSVAAAGYIKNSSKEKFELKAFLLTTCVGGVLGILNNLAGQNDPFNLTLTTASATYIAQSLLKGFWRRVDQANVNARKR